jgi:predicted RNA-binding protein YlxR (DUF448 family)
LLLNVVEEEESSVVSQLEEKKPGRHCWTTQAWTNTGLKT